MLSQGKPLNDDHWSPHSFGLAQTKKVYFQKTKWKRFLTLSYLILFCAGVVWLFRFSPLMKNRINYQVIIADNDLNRNPLQDFPRDEVNLRLVQKTQEAIANRRLDYFLFGSFERLKEHIESESLFEKVELKRTFLGQIEVKAILRIPYAMTGFEDSEWYWVDKNGVRFSPLDQKVPSEILGWIDLDSFESAKIDPGPWIQALFKNFKDSWDNVYVDTNNRVHVEIEKIDKTPVKVEFLRMEGNSLVAASPENITEGRQIESQVSDAQVSDLKRTLEEFDRMKLHPEKIQFTSDKKMVVRTFDGS